VRASSALLSLSICAGDGGSRSEASWSSFSSKVGMRGRDGVVWVGGVEGRVVAKKAGTSKLSLWANTDVDEEVATGGTAAHLR